MIRNATTRRVNHPFCTYRQYVEQQGFLKSTTRFLTATMAWLEENESAIREAFYWRMSLQKRNHENKISIKSKSQRKYSKRTVITSRASFVKRHEEALAAPNSNSQPTNAVGGRHVEPRSLQANLMSSFDQLSGNFLIKRWKSVKYHHLYLKSRQVHFKALQKIFHFFENLKILKILNFLPQFVEGILTTPQFLHFHYTCPYVDHTNLLCNVKIDLKKRGSAQMLRSVIQIKTMCLFVQRRHAK